MLDRAVCRELSVSRAGLGCTFVWLRRDRWFDARERFEVGICAIVGVRHHNGFGGGKE